MMTGNSNLRTVVFAAALGFSAIAGAHAQGWEGHGHGHMMFGLLRGVTLTDTQQQQIHSDIRAGFASAKPTVQSLHAIEEQISAVMTSPGSVSASSLTPLLQQEEALRAQLYQERVAVALEVRSVLTASQLAQAATTQSQLAALHQQEDAILGRSGGPE